MIVGAVGYIRDKNAGKQTPAEKSRDVDVDVERKVGKIESHLGQLQDYIQGKAGREQAGVGRETPDSRYNGKAAIWST